MGLSRQTILQPREVRWSILTLVAATLVLAGIVASRRIVSGSGGKDGLARAHLFNLSQAIQLFKQDQGRYPTRLEDLVVRPSDVLIHKWPPGGYVKRISDDPWGRPFVYRVPGIRGRNYDLKCSARRSPQDPGPETDIVSEWDQNSH